MIDKIKLGATEQIFEVLNSRTCSSNIVTISRVEGIITEKLLRQALSLLQERHPHLNYRICGSLNNLYFEKVVINLPLRFVDKPDNKQWQEIILEELNEKIDGSKYLLRTVLFHPKNEHNISYVVTTLHHAIADTSSNLRLHQDILTYCQKIVSTEPIEPNISLPTLPPIQEFMPESMRGFKGKRDSFLFLLKSLWKYLWYRAKSLNFEKTVPLELRHTNFVRRELNEELSQQFIHACKNEKVTVHTAICAAMLMTAAKEIRQDTAKNISVNCSNTIDIRKLLEPIVSKEHIAMLSSFLQTYHVVKTNTSFWELARDVKKQLQNGIMSGDPLCQILTASRKIADQLVSNPNSSILTVNVGTIQTNIPTDYSPFKLKEINFFMGATAYGTLFSVAAISFNKKIFLNFFYSEPSISRATMENIADSVVSYITGVAQKEKVIVLA